MTRARRPTEIGLVVLTVDRAAGTPRRFREIRRFAAAAEAAGFDALWVPDHLVARPTSGPPFGFLECWTVLSALASVTRRVKLGSFVLCTQLRSPAIVAKMAETLQEVSGGRFVLGLGVGGDPSEWKAFGAATDGARGRFEEAVKIIRSLLPGERGAPVPILVGGASARVLRVACRSADSVDLGHATTPRSLAKRLAAMRRVCKSAGRDPRTLRTSAILSIGFPDLGDLPEWFTGYVSGPVGALADHLEGFAAAGLSQLVIQCQPDSPRAVARLGRVIARYRASSRRSS